MDMIPGATSSTYWPLRNDTLMWRSWTIGTPVTRPKRLQTVQVWWFVLAIGIGLCWLVLARFYRLVMYHCYWKWWWSIVILGYQRVNVGIRNDAEVESHSWKWCRKSGRTGRQVQYILYNGGWQDRVCIPVSIQKWDRQVATNLHVTKTRRRNSQFLVVEIPTFRGYIQLFECLNKWNSSLSMVKSTC